MSLTFLSHQIHLSFVTPAGSSSSLDGSIKLLLFSLSFRITASVTFGDDGMGFYHPRLTLKRRNHASSRASSNLDRSSYWRMNTLLTRRNFTSGHQTLLVWPRSTSLRRSLPGFLPSVFLILQILSTRERAIVAYRLGEQPLSANPPRLHLVFSPYR